MKSDEKHTKKNANIQESETTEKPSFGNRPEGGFLYQAPKKGKAI